MKTTLSQKLEKMLIDESDLKLLKKPGVMVTFTSNGYVALVQYEGKIGDKYKYTRQYLHRVILNAPKNLQVDHINGNKLDNRRSNLRLCTNAKNNRNKAMVSGKYKGVHFSKTLNKWVAQITKNYKAIHIGVYETAEAAAIEYNKYAKSLHEEFAYINEVR